MKIILKERASVEISDDVFGLLKDLKSFRLLVEKNYLEIKHDFKSGASKVLLFGKNYVGHCLLDQEILLSIEPKVNDAVNALLSYYPESDLKEEPIPGSAGSYADRFLKYARDYVEKVEDYLSKGRLFYYKKEAYNSGFVAGKIDFKKTILLRSKANPVLIAQQKDFLRFDTIFNKIILYTLNFIANNLPFLQASKSLLLRTRSLQIYFGDCLSFESHFLSNDLFQNFFYNQKVFFTFDWQQRILALTELIIFRLGFCFTKSDTKTNTSIFINLETMFETVISCLLLELKPDDFLVNFPRKEEKTKFLFKSKKINIFPDFVLKRKKDSFPIVGDVKYKNFEKVPEKDDVYQLIAHCETFKSKTGVFIYPSESFSHETEETESGIKIHIFCCDLNDLRSVIRKVFLL